MNEQEATQLEEAIKHCKEIAEDECGDCGFEHKQLADWLEDYKNTREKQVAKKVEKEVVDEQEKSGYAETCPSCHKFVFDNYCANCGQKLDWGE